MDVMMISRIQIAVVGSYFLLPGFNFGFWLLEISYILRIQGLKIVKMC